MKILYTNPSNTACGIFQFGKRIADALALHLSDYGNYEFFYYENYNDVQLHIDKINEINPDIILYSYNDTALPFVHTYMLNKNPNIKHVGICHEQEQCMINMPNIRKDWYGSDYFDAWIGHDPTLVLGGNPRCFNATRPILRSEWKPAPERLTFGSSTFGFANKGHLRVVQAIQSEYDDVTIRFNMPPSIYGDPYCHTAKAIEAQCRSVLKPGIDLQVTNTLFETEAEVVEWLSGNSVNIYDFDQWEVPDRMRGVSSSPDNALSTRRPLIVTSCTMFRHLWPIFGSYPKEGSIRDLIARQETNSAPQFAYNEWAPSRTAGDYVRILNEVLK